MSDRSDGYIPAMVHPRLLARIRAVALELFGATAISTAQLESELSAIQSALDVALGAASSDDDRAAAYRAAAGSFFNITYGVASSLISQGGGTLAFYDSGAPDLASARRLMREHWTIYLRVREFWNGLAGYDDPAEAIRWMYGADPEY